MTPPTPEPASSLDTSAAPWPSPALTRWFEQEVRPHDAALRSYVRGAFPRVRDIDDVVQESYLRLWKTRLAEPVRSTKAFLFRIAQHIAIDLVRRDRISPLQQVEEISALPIAADHAGVADQACTREELALLSQALLSLPPRCREIVLLQKIDGLTQRAIADRLGLSEDTVHAHVVRGMRRCEEFMRKRKARA